MKKKMLWIACVLLALQACKEEKEHPFEGKVYREVVSVAPKIAGRVERLYVSEGEVVNAGDTLAVLEVPEVAAKRQQVEGLLQAADAQYQMALNGATKEQRERVEAQYKAAKEQYELARKTLKRLEALAQDSLIAPQTFDEAFTKYQLAYAQWQVASAALEEVKKGVRVESKLAALGQKEQVEGALQEVAIAEKERVLLAPESMTIETIALHKGELALPGYALFRGYSLNDTYFRVSVPEAIAVKHRLGEEVQLQLPHSGDILKARITSIRQLPAYATASSAYPQYEVSEYIYEVKMKAVDAAAAKKSLTHQTVIWKP